ncbi:Meiotic Sister-Chromatid recombination aldehyde dehydrogenase [Microbotryomycetes sp. JL201]|nr:Meiotic Sister-Chromatid recombination aldehyde dehydrogenase [Microbotryomycetes sp. JL201]
MTVGSTIDAWLESVPEHTLTALAAVCAVYFVLSLLGASQRERPANIRWPCPQEAQDSWRGKVLERPSITSHVQDSSLLPANHDTAKSYITCYAPASGRHLATVPSMSADEIHTAIDRAERAQLKWHDSSFERRRRVMRTLLRWCQEDMATIAKIASRDTGKTLVDAAFGEILTTCEKLRWVIANGEKILSPDKRPTNLLMAHKTSHVQYEPLGVVAAVVSWNYPAHNALSPIIASLFTGNAIVLKPSELVAWSTLYFIDAVKQCLIACGEDPELVQCCITLPDSVEALTGDERIKHITFIGSETIGKKVALKAAEAGTPVLLELGGKDPCILLSSADMDYFTPTWLRAIFQAAGQNCIGVERFLVHHTLYDQFISNVQPIVADLQLGDVLGNHKDANGQPRRVDVGAMVSDRLFDELETLIQEAVDEGARLLVGGKRASGVPGCESGHFFQPTLIVDVLPTMRLAQQELFAPVMSVMKYAAVDEAIEIANGTRYGLGASVFGREKSACDYVVQKLQCGMVCTNDFGVTYMNQWLSFGGAKSSGYGRFAGPEGLRGLCNLKAVTRDVAHGWIQTGIPPLLKYPLKSPQGAFQFQQGLVGMAYAQSWWTKVQSVVKLVTAK